MNTLETQAGLSALASPSGIPRGHTSCWRWLLQQLENMRSFLNYKIKWKTVENCTLYLLNMNSLPVCFAQQQHLMVEHTKTTMWDWDHVTFRALDLFGAGCLNTVWIINICVCKANTILLPIKCTIMDNYS